MHVKRVVSFDDAETDVAALLALLCDLHTQLNAAGVPPDGTLSERVQAALARMQTAERVIREIYDDQHGSIPHPSKVWKPGIWLVKPVDAYQGHAEWLMDEAALARMQKAERELDDLLHDVGVLSNAGIFVGGDDAEALRSDETTELLIILQAARDTQDDLRYQKRFHADAAQWWKAAAKRWRESYHALDIQYAHRELERDRWKTAAKVFRRRWRDVCAELEGEVQPEGRIMEWLRALNLYPEDIYQTVNPYIIYASFDRQLDRAALTSLSGLNLIVRAMPIRRRYRFEFRPTPDDEV